MWSVSCWGVPHQDRDRFSYWSDTFLSADRYTVEEMRSAAANLDTYLREHVAAKRATRARTCSVSLPPSSTARTAPCPKAN
jgi:cytochrome P450